MEKKIVGNNGGGFSFVKLFEWPESYTARGGLWAAIEVKKM
jgi:hypothetical protein